MPAYLTSSHLYSAYLKPLLGFQTYIESEHPGKKKNSEMQSCQSCHLSRLSKLSCDKESDLSICCVLLRPVFQAQNDDSVIAEIGFEGAVKMKCVFDSLERWLCPDNSANIFGNFGHNQDIEGLCCSGDICHFQEISLTSQTCVWAISGCRRPKLLPKSMMAIVA